MSKNRPSGFVRLGLIDSGMGFLDSVSSQEVGVAFYNAGTDVIASDPLGQLNISANTILKRDLFVVEELRKRNIPTVMVLSGGYTRESYHLVANTAIELLKPLSF